MIHRPAHRSSRSRSTALVCCLAAFGVVLAGCGGSQTSDEVPTYTPPPTTVDTSATPSKDAPPAQEEGLNSAQKEQLEIALRRGGEKAASCVGVVADAPRGKGEVKVMFDGKKGRAIDVTVEAPFAGTAVEGCIKRAFIGEIVVPFDGELEVPYTVELAPKAVEVDPKAKDPKAGAKDPKAGAKDPKKK